MLIGLHVLILASPQLDSVSSWVTPWFYGSPKSKPLSPALLLKPSIELSRPLLTRFAGYNFSKNSIQSSLLQLPYSVIILRHYTLHLILFFTNEGSTFEIDCHFVRDKLTASSCRFAPTYNSQTSLRSLYHRLCYCL